ncbi:MAG: ATPase [Planctomycetota bacterium]|nr:MAG: ATPase [Planctomycetota bacterium]
MRNTGTLKVTTPTDREIVLTRVFDAPRNLVFDAFSKPELLKRWFGPRGWSLVVCEVDLRVGGGFRFVLRGPDGRDMGMRGVYREIVPPERYMHMESFDDYPGESQVTALFVEQGGKTTLTATVLYPSREVRDAVIKSGMEHGAAESYDKLAELLAQRGSETGA